MIRLAMIGTQGRAQDWLTTAWNHSRSLNTWIQMILITFVAAPLFADSPPLSDLRLDDDSGMLESDQFAWQTKPLYVEPPTLDSSDRPNPIVTRLPDPKPTSSPQPQRWRSGESVPARLASSFVHPADQNGWTPDSGQSKDPSFHVGDVLSHLSADATPGETTLQLETPWWRQHQSELIDNRRQPMQISLDQLIQMALENSAQIRVYEKTPQIRHTAVAEAYSAFDWTQFLDSKWQDISDPVGSTLTVGGNGTRFLDNNIQSNIGVRRRNEHGGELEVNQRFGHQNTNSRFFIPNDQGTARLTLGYTQPLMRGRGTTYNRSLIVLASIDAQRATDEYQRQLQQHLLEIARAYWTLYLERSTLTQKVSLYLKSLQNEQQLRERQAIDAQRSQLVQATAAVESRKSDLIRARAAVQNAETKLRALINAPGLDENSEIIPLDVPTLESFSPDLTSEFSTAIQNRPEIQAAIKEIQAACVRTKMAKHEMLPVLDLVTETYVSGLQGNSQVGDAWLDQFRVGAPSYTIGLEWEVAVGRRAASANLRRRQLESIQLSEKYRSTLELVKAEVEVAVREVVTSYRELAAKDRARQAAIVEAETLEARWRTLGGRDNNASQLFESLISAQSRVTEAEHEVSTALLTYSLSLINLRHANGTLMQMTFE
ncbi:TolC family protein [Stieleria varia]|nr:TolC family protein [Stieleria varia]